MNIVVLCGGLSNERDVSLSSGNGVANALRDRVHNVVLMDNIHRCYHNFTHLLSPIHLKSLSMILQMKAFNNINAIYVFWHCYSRMSKMMMIFVLTFYNTTKPSISFPDNITKKIPFLNW